MKRKSSPSGPTAGNLESEAPCSGRSLHLCLGLFYDGKQRDVSRGSLQNFFMEVAWKHYEF
jgi:hypothetical protein